MTTLTTLYLAHVTRINHVRVIDGVVRQRDQLVARRLALLVAPPGNDSGPCQYSDGNDGGEYAGDGLLQRRGVPKPEPHLAREMDIFIRFLKGGPRLPTMTTCFSLCVCFEKLQ